MTLEVAGDEARTEVMDHHGLVAAICQDLKIGERIDARIGSKDPRRVVQPGTAVMAMIINGLGFTNRRLYLTPQFYQSKAVDYLFEQEITADDLNDHTLGKALDEIAAYGASRLFGEVAFEIGIEENLVGSLAHLDSTSFALHGRYDGEEAEVIEVRHGYSKDHRPDLKQVMLSLVMSGSANLPLWMVPEDGNSSDKKSFHETIASVRSFTQNLKQANDFRWIADSALYTSEKLLKHNEFKWISRVPETIQAAQTLLASPSDDDEWQQDQQGYAWTEVESDYGGLKQRWLLVSSQQAYERENKTLDQRLVQQKEGLNKACWHLSNRRFNCEADAEQAVMTLQKKYPFHVIEYDIKPVEKHGKRGRPAAGAKKSIVGYRVSYEVTDDESAIEQFRRRKGRFILATNDLDQQHLPASTILKEYKAQQHVEGGFRFLKDPWFMLDSFYVKKRSRIEALMMVMTLCLLVYNYGQYRLRSALEDQGETIPNQINKPVQNPTMKWIFQIMEGIGIIKLYDETDKKTRSIITNLDTLRCKIIRLLGRTACKIYGIKENFAGT
jgi:transposase